MSYIFLTLLTRVLIFILFFFCCITCTRTRTGTYEKIIHKNRLLRYIYIFYLSRLLLRLRYNSLFSIFYWSLFTTDHTHMHPIYVYGKTHLIYMTLSDVKESHNNPSPKDHMWKCCECRRVRRVKKEEKLKYMCFTLSFVCVLCVICVRYGTCGWCVFPSLAHVCYIVVCAWMNV